MRETERNRLWEQYHKKKTPQLREQLILEYAGVVNLVAGRLSMYLGYTVEYDDLVGYGIFGLIDAIDKYDMAKNVKFETYASLRIRGAILDEIRKMDWIPRTLRQKQKKWMRLQRKLKQNVEERRKAMRLQMNWESPWKNMRTGRQRRNLPI